MARRAALLLAVIAAGVFVIVMLPSPDRDGVPTTETTTVPSDGDAPTESRREAMDAAIFETRRDYLGDVEHSVVRTWPYVLFLENLGSDEADARNARDYEARVRAFYDYVKKTYPNVVNREPDTPFRLIVLKDRASFGKFNALNGSGAFGARAFYHLKAKFIYTYGKSEGREWPFARGVLFHECTHQLLDFLRPKNRYNESIWFEEALSDFHAGAKIEPIGDGEFTYELGHVNGARLNQMAMALKWKKFFTLSQLFRCRTYDEADQMYKLLFGGTGSRGKSLLYHQGWSFVYFCMTGPNPKYREAFLRYVDQDVGQGEGDYNILMRAFNISDDEQWEPIQREWETFLHGLIAARASAARPADGR